MNNEINVKKKRGRPKSIYIPHIVPAGKDVTDRKSIEEEDEKQNKMLLGIATEEELKWFKQKEFELRKEKAIGMIAARKARMSQREKAFWERQKNEK